MVIGPLGLGSCVLVVPLGGYQIFIMADPMCSIMWWHVDISLRYSWAVRTLGGCNYWGTYLMCGGM